MRLTLARLLADTWALARRERELLAALAGALVFLPTFAAELLLPPMPDLPVARDQAAMEAWTDAFGAWAGASGGWYLLARLIALAGTVAITALLVDRSRPDVRAALALAFWLLPRALLASILAGIPFAAGFLLLFGLGGFYVQARLAPLMAVLVTERPVSAVRAMARSLSATRRGQLALFGATTAAFSLLYLLIAPLGQLDRWLREPAHANPFVTAMVDGGLALAFTAYQVALTLIGVVAYRRAASIGM